jgi:hypothetical protein
MEEFSMSSVLRSVATLGLCGLVAGARADDDGLRVIDGCVAKAVSVEAEDAVTLEVRPPATAKLCSAAAPSGLTSVRVLGTDLTHETSTLLLSQSAFAPPSITLSFSPGDAWEPTAVEVDADASVDEILVDVAGVTVMQCSAEGPHWEFWDLKPQTSAWVPWPTALRAPGRGTPTRVFSTTPQTTMPSPAAAPRSTWTDAEVTQALSDKKVNLAEWPLDSCAPVVGEHRLRIRAKIKDKIVNVTELRLRPALGC